jgi:hypothetical protein
MKLDMTMSCPNHAWKVKHHKISFTCGIPKVFLIKIESRMVVTGRYGECGEG